MSDNELSKQRIAFIAGTLGQGGAEKQLYHLLQILTGEGVKCAVFSLTKGEYWEEKIRELGVPVIYCGGNGTKISRFISLLRAVTAFQATIIQSQHFYTNLYAITLSLLTKAIAIGAVRSELQAEIQNCGYIIGFLNLYCPSYLFINSRSSFTKVINKKHHNKKSFFLPNVVDVDFYKQCQKSNTGTFTLLAVGRFSEEKRYDRILDIYVNLTNEVKSKARVILAGTGPLKYDLMDKARKYGLNRNRCIFTGNYTDTVELYKSADVYLLTSQYEGMPNVVMEAMACGLPVVATAAGDTPELFPPELRWLVIDPYSPDAFVSVLEKLYHNPDLRLEIGRKLRNYIVDHHSLEVLRPRIIETYRSVCTGGKHRIDTAA
ncbi:MAG: glycosyltransferase [Bacteroidota bacterium]|nr:glycosyltransferase [Bacteroidota bacterium]